MMGTQYARGATRPELHLWLFDDYGQLIDMSSGYTFVSRIGDRGSPAAKEIPDDRHTGAAGSGNEEVPGSTPNLRIAWHSGDLDIAPGEFTLQIMADGGGGTPRYFFWNIEILDTILAPL
jgi:hypothetical protein